MHPSKLFFQAKHQPVSSPARDRYVGSEMLPLRLLDPLFDITSDCEDGVAAGTQEQHARPVASIPEGNKRRARIGAHVHDIHNSCFERGAAIICAAACHANGKHPLHNVTVRIRNAWAVARGPTPAIVITGSSAACKTLRRAAARCSRTTFINTRPAVLMQIPLRTLESIE